MKRVALLGATGSIGRQALEIVATHPGLELAAASSGSTPIDGLAPLTQVGGDLTELLDRAEPDVVLNAVVGFAGVPATFWALERGVDLALANKESLVAGGELAVAAWRRGGGRLLPVDSEHSAALQLLESRASDTVDSIVLTASGGPFRGRSRAELADVTPSDALAHPTWSMGPEDHGRLGDAHEQGAGTDRGALPLRPRLRPDRGCRAPDVGRARGRPVPRRRRARAPGLPRHASADLLCPDIPGARWDADRATRSRGRADPGVRRARPRGLPVPCPRARRGRGRRHRSLRRSTPRTRWPSQPSSTANCPSSVSPTSSSARSRRSTASPWARSPSWPDRRRSPKSCRGPHARAGSLDDAVNIAVAIGGLAFLILIHEAGHFVTALAVKMKPRRFYIFFPPALVKWHAQRHRIRHRLDPAGRLREDPRDAQACGRRSRRPSRAGPERGAVARRGGGSGRAGARRGALRRRPGRARGSPRESRGASTSRRARARPPIAASPTSTTRSRRRPTGVRRRRSASRSSSPARPRTTSLPSSRWRLCSCSACRPARPASWRR